MERTQREHGPLSAALLDLLDAFIDTEALDDQALTKALTMATVAWNAALDERMEHDLRAAVVQGLEREQDRADGVALFDALLAERRARFPHDPRMVMSTAIDYPNGERRVLAAGMISGRA